MIFSFGVFPLPIIIEYFSVAIQYFFLILTQIYLEKFNKFHFRNFEMSWLKYGNQKC